MRTWIVKTLLVLSFFVSACGSGGGGEGESVNCLSLIGNEALSQDAENSPINVSDNWDNWTVRWGTSTPDSAEPPMRLCPVAPMHQSLRITTNSKDAVILEWHEGSQSAELRTISVSFMVPSFKSWGHLAAFAAYRPPLPDHDPNPSYAFGRIGADVFHDPIGIEPDRFVIQFDPASMPLYNNTNVHGWVTIPGGLQEYGWYRVNADIIKMPDGGLRVSGILQNLENDGAVVASTEMFFPQSAVPPWYDTPETRPAVGVMDTDPTINVDTYIADISFSP